MTTSPSWFDQDKFSSLVKKVGVNPKEKGPAAPGLKPAPTVTVPPVAKKPELVISIPVVPKPREVSRSFISEPETAPLPTPVAEGSSLHDLKEELERVIKERDGARREYGNLREEFETLQQEATRLRDTSLLSPIDGPGNWEAQRNELIAQLTIRDEEISNLQITTIGMQDVIETFKQELAYLQEQLLPAQELAEQAQRELAAVQMELQVTAENAAREIEASKREAQEARDALNESSGNSAQNQSNMEKLKNECSSLVQQNMFLQAQHDQLSRELSAAKARVASKVEPGANKPLRA